MKEQGHEMKLPKLDDLFTNQAQRDYEKAEKVEEIDISKISDFPNHPFKVNDDDKEDQLLFKITEVKDLQNVYCDWEIKGVPSLFGGLQMALLATDIKALSPLSSYVDAANIYPKVPTPPQPPRNTSGADIPDNLFK